MLALALATTAALVGGPVQAADADMRGPDIGLLSTLPIYWGEVAEFTDLLQENTAPHWVRTEIERSHELVPLDNLADPEHGLGRFDTLILAQPRALYPVENLALDQWVRGGGHLLLFADPMLTEHSRFPIGDRRRPQDVALLSPILGRWGLNLRFDESQPEREWHVEWDGLALPVNQAGHFEPAAPAEGGEADCALEADGVIARCAIGEGQALLVADAAVLEQGHAGEEAVESLRRLLAQTLAGRSHP